MFPQNHLMSVNKYSLNVIHYIQNAERKIAHHIQAAFTNPSAPVRFSNPATCRGLEISNWVPFDFHSYGVYSHILFGARGCPPEI